MAQNSIDYRIKQSQNELENFSYYKALNHLNEALDEAKKAEDSTRLGSIYTLKGRLQLLTDNSDNAIKSLNSAIEIQRLIKNDTGLAYALKTLGEVYFNEKYYNQAHDYFVSAKNLFQQQGLQQKLAETLLLDGKTFMLLNNYVKAREIIEQALAIAKKSEYPEVESDALINQAVVFNVLGENDKALNTAEEGLQIAELNKYLTIRNAAYKTLSEIYYDRKNYKNSRDYLDKHLKLTDSLYQLKSKSLASDQQTKSILKDTTKQYEEAKKQLEQVEEDNGVRTLISILSVALITILSLLTLSLYKNNNIRLKTNNMLHKKNGELIIAKEKAELATKTKANFLSTVTHELRTPLYAVTGLTNMLLEENPKPDQIQHLKSLKFSGDYLLTFINDILQINKIEANKVEIESEPFNLKKKINNIILALNNSAEDNQVKIHFEYDKNLPENFIADQIKISQILINLIGNSIKFTKNGDIWIRVYKIAQENNNYRLRFEVEDNGIGISQEKQDKMFESFSQGSIQINRKYGGTGLGLSIVKGLIDILKGDIYVKSELDKGTTFYFEIPVEYTPIEQASTEPKSSYFNDNSEKIDLDKVKVLVVEDNKINQMITKKILTKMKLNCELVDNGEDAVELIKNNKYDIVLMDIHMPGISGIEATKRIRTFDKKLTIFALTAVTIEDKMQEFEEAGFSDIIPKPFKQEEFEKKLYNALTGKKYKAFNQQQTI
ncbi:ATP-binding protein [Gaetbulibacter aestuarii]